MLLLGQKLMQMADNLRLLLGSAWHVQIAAMCHPEVLVAAVVPLWL